MDDDGNKNNDIEVATLETAEEKLKALFLGTLSTVRADIEKGDTGHALEVIGNALVAYTEVTGEVTREYVDRRIEFKGSLFSGRRKGG